MPSGANHSRLTSITYPSGYVLTCNYSSGINDTIRRLPSLSDTTGTLESYSYLGLGTVVIRSHPQPANHLASLRRQPGEAGISGLTTPVYDANGNMTTDQTGKQFVYDAWNRMVRVKDSGGTTLETFSYDGRNHRVTNTIGSTTANLYYSNQWQVMEEQVSGSDVNRYVWSPVYVNAMVLRDRDSDANGTLDERLWPTEDANWDIMALVNSSGVVVERYAYDPYGVFTVYDGSYTVRSGGTSYASVVLFQGGRQDVMTGNKDFQRRDLNAATGTWTAIDPKLFQSGDENLYRAEGDNPTARVDPQGTDWDPWKATWWYRQGHRFVGGMQTVGGGLMVAGGATTTVATSTSTVGTIGGVVLAGAGVDLIVHGVDQVWDPRNPTPSPTWLNQGVAGLTGSDNLGNLAEAIESLGGGGAGIWRLKKFNDHCKWKRAGGQIKHTTYTWGTMRNNHGQIQYWNGETWVNGFPTRR